MAGYIKYQREFRASDLYRKSSCAQREVLWAFIERVQYCERVVDFGGTTLTLFAGDVWLSRGAFAKSLAGFGVTEVHVRNMIKKLVNRDYITKKQSSNSGGTIYRCLERFYAEIAEPFDIRKEAKKLEKLTNERPARDQPLTNERPTKDLPNTLSINELRNGLTNERPTIDQPLTNERPTIDPNRKHKEELIKKNDEMISEKSDFEFEKKDSFTKNPSFEFERKKVAAKKESEFPAASDELSKSSLSIYTNRPESIKFFEDKFPSLDIREEFEKIVASRGDDPVANVYSFVMACLKNALQYNQLPKTKKPSNGKSKSSWAEQNGKILDRNNYRLAKEQGGNVFV